MNDVETLALRYAQAFMHLYADRMTFDEYKRVRQAIIFLRRHDLLLILQTYSDDVQAIKACISMLCQHLNLMPSFEKLLFIVQQKNRLMILPEILQAILWEYERVAKTTIFSVSCASSLGDEDRQEFEKFLNKLSGHTNIYEYTVDPTLIAGIQAASTEYRWDHSIRGRLRALKAIAQMGVE